MSKTSEYQKRAAFYIRVSTDDQVEKYGVELQRAALDALIKSRGQLEDGTDAMVLAGEEYVYVDEGISGTINVDERPSFSRLLEDIESSEKPFDVVIVYKIDRFARRLKILLEVVDLFEEYKIEFISANESIDTSSPFGKAILGIVGVIAELEIETTKLRTQDGRKQAISNGVFMGQIAPFGYDKDAEKRLIPFEQESKIVSNIFAWFVYENLTLQQIADRLTEDEILSPDASAIHYGKRKGSTKKRNKPYFWRYEKIREILEDEVYIGKYLYSKSVTDKALNKVVKVEKEDWKVSPHRHQPIVEPLVFQKAQLLLKDLGKKINLASKRKNAHLYLLSGLLRCHHCSPTNSESDMMTWIGDRKSLNKIKGLFSYYYKCGRKNKRKYSDTCSVLPVPAEPLEEYILDFVKDLLKNPKYVYDYHQNLKSTKQRYKHLESRRELLRSRLNSIPERIENLKDQHRDGFIKNTNELREKIAEQKNKAKEYSIEIEKMDDELGKHEISKGYLQVFEQFAEKYKGVLETLFVDAEETYRLVHSLISKIVVYSRPVTDLDSVAGRKTDNQQIPWTIEIKLRLPQEMIVDLAETKFRVRSDKL